MQDTFSAMKKFKQWKEEHPEHDYQIDELHDFVSQLKRCELWAIMNFVYNNYDIEL